MERTEHERVQCGTVLGEGLIIQGILEALRWLLPARHTGFGDKFNVHLNPLARMLHLFIRLWRVLEVWQLDGHDASFAQKPVQPGDRTGISPLTQFHPEHHDPCIWVPPSDIED